MQLASLLASSMAEALTARMSVSLSFSIGDLFSTFDELEAKVKTYERTHFVQFWKRDALTIAAAGE